MANYVCNPYPQDEQEKLVFDNERFQVSNKELLLEIVKSMELSKIDPIASSVVINVAFGHQDKILDDIRQPRVPEESLPIIREILVNIYTLSHKFVGDMDHHGKYGSVNISDMDALMQMIQGD